ncbi:PIN domain-containing protein [Aliarcobacter cryaerophilus]|jgi:predicted nucleic acid-binding protein|uniref:DNA-binding protein n=1 Tax=Aliarcobacter cryaerophilus TaxID=28198 RepID=A0A2S9T4V7_9BACT|nr:PIN domain-containing protein [Aliarcobacter cryaerophilus]PRM93873.1 DNA-binding protein [Aliarcobacter cryaerophilus]
MSDKVFIDTNILIYAFSEDEPQKQQIALSLIESVTYDATISNQVINELANVFLKKFKLSTSAVEDAILELDSLLNIVSFDISTQIKALRLKERYKLQYFDSLIISTALENKCSILYSEDMQHEIVIDNRLKIINPFN